MIHNLDIQHAYTITLQHVNTNASIKLNIKLYVNVLSCSLLFFQTLFYVVYNVIVLSCSLLNYCNKVVSDVLCESVILIVECRLVDTVHQIYQCIYDNLHMVWQYISEHNSCFINGDKSVSQKNKSILSMYLRYI